MAAKKSKVNAAGNYSKPTMRKNLVAKVKASGKGGSPGQWSARKAQIAPEDQELWDELRECRKMLSDEFNVPPYVIFHDATLKEMLDTLPTSEAELLTITGVGESKLEKYGGDFLDILRRHAGVS